MIVALLGLSLLGPPDAAAPEPEEVPAAGSAVPTTDDPVLTDYLIKMRTAGLLDDREATLEEVESILQGGQDQYIRGNSLGSAIILFELTHNPRYENFQETPEMGSAWYHLGVSLQSYGAHFTAQAAYAEVIKKGTDEPYFTPALRRHVDLALLGKEYTNGLAELDLSLTAQDGSKIELTGVDLDEYEYLEARAYQERGDLNAALQKYDAVDDKSRFYTASKYMSGYVHAGRRDFRKAESAFCEVVGGPTQETASYYVDKRYFPVRDLAHLGLGRVAHEEARHGHAFYHYFSIPQDSPELPQALFEAAWTMAEEGEYAVARGLLKELRERYPDAPQTEEARVLEALMMLYDCDFREAEKRFTSFIDDMAPVTDHIEEIRRDPDQLRALHRELARLRTDAADGGDAGTPGSPRSGDTKAHALLLAMMDEDPTYARMTTKADSLRQEAKFVGALDGELGRIQAELSRSDTAARDEGDRTPGHEALDAIAAAADLERGVAGLERQIREADAAGADEATLQAEREQLKALRERVRTLRREATQMLKESPPIGTAQTATLNDALARDRARLVRTRTQSLKLANDLDDEAAKVAADRLGDLNDRIDGLMGEARMGRIDAVLGAKKKLEIEVRDMAAGRFPPELFGKLQIEGLVGDDEEFWPYQGEYWADEYEGYR